MESAIVYEVTTKVKALLMVLKIDYGSLCNRKEMPELYTERKIACYYLSKTLRRQHICKIVNLDLWTVDKYIECIQEAISEDTTFTKIIERIEQQYEVLHFDFNSKNRTVQ
jgi:hypothetical protein